jgi:hypothetical protein
LECVLLAVDFDDELSGRTGEVRKVGANGMLPAKFDTVHAVRAD